MPLLTKIFSPALIEKENIEQVLGNIFEKNSWNGIFIQDIETLETIYVNKVASETLGYNFEELLGKNPELF
ncbi:MAG: PAS domain-containing protein [Desulfosudis oleivorans]|nr:PAS domain-containing protein [Desulfosudis oleivorans]